MNSLDIVVVSCTFDPKIDIYLVLTLLDLPGGRFSSNVCFKSDWFDSYNAEYQRKYVIREKKFDLFFDSKIDTTNKVLYNRVKESLRINWSSPPRSWTFTSLFTIKIWKCTRCGRRARLVDKKYEWAKLHSFVHAFTIFTFLHRCAKVNTHSGFIPSDNSKGLVWIFFPLARYSHRW